MPLNSNLGNEFAMELKYFEIGKTYSREEIFEILGMEFSAKELIGSIRNYEYTACNERRGVVLRKDSIDGYNVVNEFGFSNEKTSH